jgi:hypothetical protein
VAVPLPQGHKEPTVIRLVFLGGPNGPINATLVL